MRRKIYDSYDLFAKVADGRAQVTVDAIDSGDKFVNELDTDLEVIDPATNKVAQTITMAQTAAGRYTADFKIQTLRQLPAQGRAQARRQDRRRVARLRSPCPTRSSTCARRRISSRSSMPRRCRAGMDQAEPAKLWDPGKQSVDYTQDLWPYVLLGVVGLFLLDLYSKRVRLFGYRTIKF